MTATAQKYDPKSYGNCGDQYLAHADTDHLKKLMRRDIAGFYNRLSVTGKRILAALIQSAPDSNSDKPFPFVISSLQHNAKCSKLSVLRTIPKGEKAGLFQRKNHKSGRRHGSIITLYNERCEYFLSLYKQEYGLLADTDQDRYQVRGVTNADRYQINFGNRQHQQGKVARSLNIADNTDLLFSRLSDQGKRVFGIISSIAKQTEQDEVSLVIQSVARDAACSEVTARRVIKQGHESGLYTKRQHQRGPRFGIILKLNSGPIERMQELLQTFPAQLVTNGDRYQAGVTKHDRYHDRNDTDPDTKLDRYPVTNAILDHKQTVIPCQSRADSNSAQQPVTKADRYQNPVLLDRQIKNLSGSEENEEERWARRLLSISVDEFQILWPRLHEERFGPDQIHQIVQHRLSFNETILDIENSLHAAEWELEHDTFPEARKGPCNYLFATLKSKGTWRRPVGFMTPNEQALANAKKEKAVIRELQELDKQKSKEADQAAQNEKFEAWLKTQTPEDLEAIDALCSMRVSTEATKRSWRKSYWAKKHPQERSMKNVLLILFFLHALIVVYLLHVLGYRINLTDSMPHGIYQIVPGKPGRGDLVTFSLAEDNPYYQISLERHYLGLNGNRPLLKILAGLPGDSIEITASGVRINSELLPHTQTKNCDRHSRQLPTFLKSTVIPSAKGLALSTYTENSFDGRYFGLVDMDQVQRVIPILTFRLLKNSDLLRCCEKSKPSRMSNTLRPCIFLAPCISPFLNNLFNLE